MSYHAKFVVHHSAGADDFESYVEARRFALRKVRAVIWAGTDVEWIEVRNPYAWGTVIHPLDDAKPIEILKRYDDPWIAHCRNVIQYCHDPKAKAYAHDGLILYKPDLRRAAAIHILDHTQKWRGPVAGTTRDWFRNFIAGAKPQESTK